MLVDDAIDEVAAFGVEGFAGDTEHVESLRGGHGDDDVGVRQELAASIIDGDDALADVAGAVGDDGGGGDADVSVPGLSGLCIPDDLDCLPDGEFADLRLVEVGMNLDLVEVGDSRREFRLQARNRRSRRGWNIRFPTIGVRIL